MGARETIIPTGKGTMDAATPLSALLVITDPFDAIFRLTRDDQDRLTATCLPGRPCDPARLARVRELVSATRPAARPKYDIDLSTDAPDAA